ncbi:hypothetical protein [Blastopirellula marina]|uniref:Lipoprotein n=1 Tax=Blastopirellula marina DSM 3645 TaxID=314230 RepID=A4A2P9_9BACT|nr:hypothetical protein [Blastopirellula marina]EAQ76973.1 hypothetical protein DSM3645_06369 [Blastopirellula marina DSM 3645]
MNYISYAICAVMAVTLLTASGCGAANSNEFSVAGVVTFKGAPVPRGTVTFSPDSSQGNSGPAITTDIVDGKFDTAGERFGMTEGAYRIQIYGYDGNAKPEMEIPLGRALFNAYRTETEITQQNAGELTFSVAK